MCCTDVEKTVAWLSDAGSKIPGFHNGMREKGSD